MASILSIPGKGEKKLAPPGMDCDPHTAWATMLRPMVMPTPAQRTEHPCDFTAAARLIQIDGDMIGKTTSASLTWVHNWPAAVCASVGLASFGIFRSWTTVSPCWEAPETKAV